jgi:hypothetical protein
MSNRLFGLFGRGQQNEQPRQNQCSTLGGTCSTVTVEREYVRQEVHGKACSVPVSQGTAAGTSYQSVPQPSSTAAKPLDTSKAIEISNGLRVQPNKDGSVTVTIPLTADDIGIGSKAQYTVKTPTSSSTQPVSLGESTQNFISHGNVGGDLVAHKVYNRGTKQWELQVTLKDVQTTGRVTIGDRVYDLEPSKLKAEMLLAAMPPLSPSDIRLSVKPPELSLGPTITTPATPPITPSAGGTPWLSPLGPKPGGARSDGLVITAPILLKALEELNSRHRGLTGGMPESTGMDGKTAPPVEPGLKSIPDSTPVGGGSPKVDLNKAPQDPELVKLREKLQLAISYLTGTDGMSRAADIKSVLKETLNTLDRTEARLLEVRSKLVERYKNFSISGEERAEVARKLEEVDNALKGGLATTLKEMGLNKPEDFTKFDATVFAKKFDDLLKYKLPPLPTKPAPGADAGAPPPSTETKIDADRGPSEALKEIIDGVQGQLDSLNKIANPNVSKGRENLANILEDARVVAQRLLEKRQALVKAKADTNEKDPSKVAEQIREIDKVLDQDLPRYLKQVLFKKETGTLTDLSSLTRVDIRTQFRAALAPTSTSPSISGREIKEGERIELKLEIGEAVQIRTASGDVVVKARRIVGTDGKAVVRYDLNSDDEKIASLEIDGGKLFLKANTIPEEKREYTLEYIDGAPNNVTRSEKFSIIPTSGAAPSPSVDAATELAQLKTDVKGIFALMEGPLVGDSANPKVLEELVSSKGFSREADGSVKKASTDGTQEFRVNDTLEVTATTRAVATPAIKPPVTPAPTANAEAQAEMNKIKALLSSPTLSDAAQRKAFLGKLEFEKRSEGTPAVDEWVKVSSKDATQKIVVGSLNGTPSVELRAIAPATPTAANPTAVKELEDLKKTLAEVADLKLSKPFLEAADYKQVGDRMVKPSADTNYNLVVDKAGQATLELVEKPSAAPSKLPEVVPTTPPPASTPSTPPELSASKELALQQLNMQKNVALRLLDSKYSDSGKFKVYAKRELEIATSYAAGEIESGKTATTLESVAVLYGNKPVLTALGYERSTEFPGYLIRKVDGASRLVHPGLGLAEEHVFDTASKTASYYRLTSDLTRGDLLASFQQDPSGKQVRITGEHKFKHDSWVTDAEEKQLDKTVGFLKDILEDYTSSESERTTVFETIQDSNPAHRSYIQGRYEELAGRTLLYDLSYHAGEKFLSAQNILQGFDPAPTARVLYDSISGYFSDNPERAKDVTAGLTAYQRRAVIHEFNSNREINKGHGKLEDRLKAELKDGLIKDEILKNLGL